MGMEIEMGKDTTCYLLTVAAQEVLNELNGEDPQSSTAYLKLRHEIKKLIEQGGNHFLIEPMDIVEWWIIQIILDLSKTFKNQVLSYTVVQESTRDYDWLEEHPEEKQFILTNARELVQTEISEYYIAKHVDLFRELELSTD